MLSRRLIRKSLIFITVFVNLAVLSSKVSAEVKTLGVVGVTYEIRERDALKEITDRASRVNWKAVFDKEKFKEKLEKYRPNGLKVLPKARRQRSFLVDMSYTLEFDIKDRDGRVIYPKGYTFNPLDYMKYPYMIVVIDPERKEELRWFKSSEYYRDHRVLLMVTDGVPIKLTEKLQMPVYYLTRPVLERLKLEHTPSVVRQKGRFMEVTEYAVSD